MDSSNFEYGPTEIVLTVVASVIVYLYYSYTASRIFAKAGIPAWQGWVPFLNSWRLLQLGGQAGWWVLVAFIPIVGHVLYLIFYWIAQYNIGIAFGKSGAFVVLAVLLSPVWFGILAFDSSRWEPKHVSRVPAA